MHFYGRYRKRKRYGGKKKSPEYSEISGLFLNGNSKTVSRTQYLITKQDGYYIGQITAIKGGQYDGYVALNDGLYKYFNYQIRDGNIQNKTVTVLNEYLKAGLKVEMHISHSPSSEPVEEYTYTLCYGGNNDETS